MNARGNTTIASQIPSQSYGFQQTTGQKRAREIMGNNFVSIEKAIRHLRIAPTTRQLAALAEIPFSEAVLTACKATHVLIAVFPISLLEVRGRFDCELFCSEAVWYNSQVFAEELGETGWHLVRKTPVETSIRKTWSEQRALISNDEQIPTARLMVYTIISHFLAVGERLFETVYVRCSDVVSDGSRVIVGHFNSEGLFVDHDWDHYRYDSLGLASARKSH